MKSLAIEGINGAGKTPTINKIVDGLRGLNIAAEAFAPYHLVRDKIDLPDIYPLWSQDPEKAVECLHETLDDIEETAAQKKLDVTIYDRHWLTAFSQQYKVPNIEELWGDRLVHTALFTAPLEHSLRLAKRDYKASWLQADTLEFYTKTYEDLSMQFPQYILGVFAVSSTAQDLQPIADSLIDAITQGLNPD